MVRVRYAGVTQARAVFEALRPLHGDLTALQGRCPPSGPDYRVLDAARKALATAAFHFTGEPDFFAKRPPT